MPCVKSQAVSPRGAVTDCRGICPTLIGSSNQVPIIIEGRDCTALLDSGSQISTIGESYCRQLGLEVKALEGILQIKAAGGHHLPYHGLVEATIGVPEPIGRQMETLLLVVPDTEFQLKCPVLLGTNVLCPVVAQLQQLQVAVHNLPLQWKVVYQCLSTRPSASASLLTKTTQSMKISPEEQKTITAIVHTSSIHRSVCVLSEENPSHPLPGGVVLTPTLYRVDPGSLQTDGP